MIDALFVNNHTDFVPNGVLRPMLETCFASLLMYYPNTEYELGPENILVIHIRNAAIKAKIEEFECDTPVQVLKLWSKKIREDFNSRNSIVQKENKNEILPAVKSLSRTLDLLNKGILKLIEK